MAWSQSIGCSCSKYKPDRHPGIGWAARRPLGRIRTGLGGIRRCSQQPGPLCGWSWWRWDCGWLLRASAITACSRPHGQARSSPTTAWTRRGRDAASLPRPPRRAESVSAGEIENRGAGPTSSSGCSFNTLSVFVGSHRAGAGDDETARPAASRCSARECVLHLFRWREPKLA
jgi:hypothetical protein